MMAKYQFPLEDTDYYSGKIIFQVLKEIPPSIKTSGPSTKVDPDSPQTKEESTLGLSVFSQILSGANSAELTTTDIVFGDRATLFLPQGIQFNDGVSYEDFDLGRIGGAAELGVKSGGSLGSVFKSAASQSITSMTELFSNSLSPDAARLATARIAKAGNTNVGMGVTSALQVTSNPNKRVLFREVNIREFSFNFKLIPTSKREGNMIVSLVKFFREELYPEDSIRVDTTLGSLPIGYKFPNKFEITFKHNNKRIAHKLLPAHLVSMQTVYNPTGMGFFEDGNFSEIEITMNFRESRTLNKRDIRDGGY